MAYLALCLLAVVPGAADRDAPPAKKTPPAQVTITAELACLHCTFGEGEECAVCLKLDEKTPVMLAGKAAKQFAADRLTKKVVVVEGALSIKDKRLLLTSDNARLYTDKDKGKVPDKGVARVAGTPCCGQCDLGVCDVCTLAVVNPGFPLVLDGKLAQQHGKEAKAITAIGRLYIDKSGLLRLDAQKVDLEKK